MFNPLHYLMKLKARKELRKNRADLYYDIATSLEDRVPLFTTFRKYEARARRRKPGEALVYLDMLRALGCETVQGYWLGRPVPADQVHPLALLTG